MSTSAPPKAVHVVKHDEYNKPDQVVIHAYPPLIFIWPIIVLGFLFFVTDGHLLSSKAEAWVYILSLVTVLLTIGIDMNRNVTLFWIVLIAGGWFAALYLRDVKQFMIFDNLLHRVANLNPSYSADLGLIVSVILLIFYVIMVAKAWLNDRWRFVNNEIEHHSFARGDDAMGRGAKRISTSYPDVLEFLLLGAGTITIYSAQGRTELASIPRVPLLPFRARRIALILESVSISPAVADEELEAHEHESEDVSGDTHGLQ